MQHLLEDLSQLLIEEYRNYERLFTMSQAEQRCLVGNDTAGIDTALVEIREVVSRVQSLGERRALLLCRISEQTGISTEQLTVSRLGQMARGPLALRLERLGQEFKALMGRLHKLNGTNLLLIRNSLDMNDRTARLILGETGQVQFYGEAGGAEGAAGPKILSRRM